MATITPDCRRVKKAAVVLLLPAAIILMVTQYWNVSRSQRHYKSVVEVEDTEVEVCQVPAGGFKAWNQGVITLVQPKVEANCSKLIAGDKLETGRVARETAHGPRNKTSYAELLQRTRNCSWMVEYFRNNLYNTKLETSFPMAFSFVVHDSPEQFLRLLKLLYRPQNVYCIHPDKKSQFQDFFTSIAKCFHNIIISHHRVAVGWGQKSLLESQMHCLSDLVQHRNQQEEEDKWQYVINLCGKELPLVSTSEMVKKLMYMNGTSSVVSWSIPSTETWTMKRLRGKTLPYNLTYYKSMTYNALSKSFVQFLLTNSTAQKSYEFFLETDFPEEHFYATLFRMPGVPGGHNHHIPDDRYFEVGHYFWRTNQLEIKLPCFGETVHGICVINYADLPRVMSETKNGSTALFQNKYFMENDYVAMDCMEKRIVAMNKREFKLECSE